MNEGEDKQRRTSASAAAAAPPTTAITNVMSSVLLVTANIGSIFEQPEFLLKTWINEFVSYIKKYQPRFVAVHCQEVGGKNYENSMRHVEQFLRMLMSSEELSCYDKIRVFLDEDFTCSEKFTALGNLYFIHEHVSEVHLWDFEEAIFVPVYDKEVHSGNIEKVTTKEKQKFPQEFFPECKWSRKGFLRTRWNISGTVFDLINIHLFHDASNFVAMESFPSPYSENRRRALEYTVNRFMNESENQIPFFIFGDFNFRLDTQGVVNRLTEKAVPWQENSGKNGELTKLIYTESGNKDKILLAIEQKVFDFIDHTKRFMDEKGEWREFDRESEAFAEFLHEYSIKFAPSYPFSEDYNNPSSYMKTRCPAWCDRVLLSKNALNLVCSACNDDEAVLYDLMGPNVCMGDHKPVFLLFNMKIHPPGTCIIVTKSSHNIVRSSSANFSVNPAPAVDLFSMSTSQNNLLKPPTPHLRFISHHSSSCEEWYDDVKLLRRQNALDHSSDGASENELDVHDQSSGSDSGVVQSVEADHDDDNGYKGGDEQLNKCHNCQTQQQINVEPVEADTTNKPVNSTSNLSTAPSLDSVRTEKKKCRGKCCVIL